MRVPEKLSTAFGQPFEDLIARFSAEQKLLPQPEELRSVRFLARSVVPHVEKLSGLFNRAQKKAPDSAQTMEEAAPSPRRTKAQAAEDQRKGLDPYWKRSSNPAHLRLAYFIYFMPCNLYRVASVWAELQRLGFRWDGRALRGIEFGAGPASGACGISAGEKFAPTGLPSDGNWALIEQDKAMLELGSAWAREYFEFNQSGDWGIRPFHRKLELASGFLPRTAPKFNLWLMSYVLNEFSESPGEIARTLMDAWEKHLDDEGIAILVEPALKQQSRKLLEIRKALIEESRKRKNDWFKILLPCLGHQNCGALAESEDWCHEEVSWWRPPYFRTIDKMAGLDRKSLPFSYLVIARSSRSREAILPALAESKRRDRLVSPAHFEGHDQEFFICGQDGKKRARYRPSEGTELERGDILTDVDSRGDTHSTRIQTVKKIL